MRQPKPHPNSCPRRARPARLPALQALALWLICSLPLMAEAQEHPLPAPPGMASSDSPMVAPPTRQYPTANCVPELDQDRPASWRLIDKCNEPQIHGIVQQLLNLQRTKDREQSQRYPRLVGYLAKNDYLYWQLPGLTRGVRAILQMAKLPQASEEETQAASALAAGKPELAIAILGKMATGTWAAELLREQAALQRTTNLPLALALAEKAAALDEHHQFNLRNLAYWSEMSGDLPRALDWHRRVARRLDSDLNLKPNNMSMLWSISNQAIIMGNLEYELQHQEETLKHWQRSSDALDKMLKISPKDVYLQRNQSDLANRIGNLLVGLGRHEEALKPYRRAVMLRQQVLALAPDLTRPMWEVVISLINLGSARIALEQYADALELYRQALPLQLKLQATNPSNTEWDAHLANTHNRLGELASLFNQPASDALASHLAARSILSKLVALPVAGNNAASTANWQRELAMTHRFIADVQRKQQQYTEAMASYQTALAIGRKLIEQDASVNLWQHDLANTWARIAELQKLQEQKSAALASYRIEVAIRQRLHARLPEHELWRHELAASHDSIGEMLTALGQHEEALKPYQAALALRQKWPGSETIIKLRSQAASWARLAAVQYRLGQWEASLQSNQAELGLRRKVLDLEPDEPIWQRELALMGLFLGDLHQILNRPEEGLRQYRDAISQLGKLAQAQPASETKQAELALGHGKIGKLLQKMADFPAATQAFQAALAISRPLATKHPENREMQANLATDLSYLGNLQYQQGLIAEALKNDQAALSIMSKLNLAEPKQVRWKASMAMLYMRVGDSHAALGNDLDALSNFNAALEWQKQASSEQTGTESQIDLVTNHIRIGDMQIRVGYFDAALQSFQAAQSIMQPLLASDPGASLLQRNMAAILLRIGDTQGDLKNFPAAETHLQQALQMRQKLLQAEPQDAQLHINLATVHASLGMMHEAQKQAGPAIAQFQLAQAISDRLVAKEPKVIQWQLTSAGFAGRIANVDGSSLSISERKDLLQTSISRIKRVQREQTLPNWANAQLLLLEKKLDELNHPERAHAAAAAAAATAPDPANPSGTEATPAAPVPPN